MKALSFSRPWDYVIMHCGKDIENRRWRTKYRGLICVHRAKSWDKAGFRWLSVNQQKLGLSDEQMREIIRRQFSLTHSALVGTVEITDCVMKSDSPWYFGPYGFTLANAKAFESVVPCAGKLGIWHVQDEIARQVVALL